jgi:molecular chaperone GrpE
MEHEQDANRAHPAEPDASAQQPVTSRDEADEPSGEEDPANEAERVEEDSIAPPRAEPAASRTAEEAEAEDPLARAQRERDEYLDLARRAQADFENYRKRAAKEAAAAGDRAKSGLVRELLPVVDNLERALESAQSDDGLAEGVRLVLSDLQGVLAREGVEVLEPVGERFDPTLHEALSTRPQDGAEAGVVLDVVQKGYRMSDTVIRPARVVVSA